MGRQRDQPRAANIHKAIHHDQAAVWLGCLRPNNGFEFGNVVNYCAPVVGPVLDLFLQAKQHVPELDLVIGRTNGFEFELSIRLECLNTASGNYGSAGRIPIRGSPIDFRLGIGIPNGQYDSVSLTVVDDGFCRRADAKGATRQGFQICRSC